MDQFMLLSNGETASRLPYFSQRMCTNRVASGGVSSLLALATSKTIVHLTLIPFQFRKRLLGAAEE